MPRPRYRPYLHVTLTGGPCHGRECTIPRALWERGMLIVHGEPEQPFTAEEALHPYGPLPPVYAYQRQLMVYRATPGAKLRYRYEWHYYDGGPHAR